MSPSMLAAADLYEVASAARTSRVRVADPEVQRFSQSVTALLRRLGDDAADAHWAPVVRRLRKIRWELATTPLPINHPALALSESAAFVAGLLRGCDRIYPAHAPAARAISEQLEALATSESDPLSTAIIRLLRGDEPAENQAVNTAEAERGLGQAETGRLASLPLDPVDAPAEDLLGGLPETIGATTAVVLRHSRHAGAVEHRLAAAGHDVTVVSPAQLSQPAVYGRAVVIGAMAWFPSHVLAAPKAFRMDVVQYAWIRDEVPPSSIFAGSAERAPVLPDLDRPPGAAPGSGDSPADPAELLPPADWATISARSAPGEEPGLARSEQVEAYLLLLASDEAVHLEADEGSRAYVVALGAEKELRQVPTRSIEPGTFLVTREGGEGDYIPAIADSLLGERGSGLRAAQRRWKAMLQDLVSAVGLRAVVGRLEAAGSSRATEMNARRWVSDASIRTQDFQDFQAIMSIIGLEEEAQALWEKMALIDQAHLRAGQRVRALLNREILEADTRELERRGWMDYDVAEIEGEGALRVARVEARAPETVRVSARRTRRPFPVERDLWQG